MRTSLILLFVLCLSVHAQSTFCDGWEDGYAAGKKSLNDNIYITPICPIPGFGEDTYQIGYSQGFEKATGKQSIVIPDNNNTKKDDAFCNGWEAGYTSAMNENDKSIFITPICPISGINEDTYDDGFIKGYQRGLKDLGKTGGSNIIVKGGDGQVFCDGWERGYQFGLEEWATANNKSKPWKSTPICPIPEINKDTYYDGFERGKAKALEDMNN